MILILGRFQPFHNGHLKLVEEAYKMDSKLIIAIGSASKEHTKENPFPSKIRKQMIEKTLDSKNIKAKVILVPNIICDNNYVEHVEKCIKCSPGKIITENPWTIDIFKKKGYKIIKTKRHGNINATDIRERIVKDKTWKSLVPETVQKIINKYGIQKVKDAHSISEKKAPRSKKVR